MEGRTNLHVLANSTMTAVRYQDVLHRPIVRLLVQWALGSSWCRTMPSLVWPECVRQFLDDKGIDTID